jgi:hypothetical protein
MTKVFSGSSGGSSSGGSSSRSRSRSSVTLAYYIRYIQSWTKITDNEKAAFFHTESFCFF